MREREGGRKKVAKSSPQQRGAECGCVWKRDGAAATKG